MDNGKKLDNENGFALLYTLGMIVLVILILLGIFLVAKNTYGQINQGDKMSRLKDAEEYALKDVSNQVKKKIDKMLSPAELGSTQLGQTETVIDNQIDELLNDLATTPISNSDIGNKQQFAYEATITKKNVTKIFPFISTPDSLAGGWVQGTTMDVENTTSCRVVLEVSVTVDQKAVNNQRAESGTAKSEIVYEIQWEKKDSGKDGLALDVWRNIYYQYEVPNGINYLSADEWMRKMQHIYEYQQGTPSYIQKFPYSTFNPNNALSLGMEGQQLVDYQDGSLMDFWSAKPFKAPIDFSGSFILRNGVQMKGTHNTSELITHNMLALRNDLNNGAKTNVVKNLSLKAGTGMYVTVTGVGDQNRLVVDNIASKTIMTPNLLINDSTEGTYSKNNKAGFFLGQGRIDIGSSGLTDIVNFQKYYNNPRIENPQNQQWGEFLKGGFVIASSNVYLKPTTINQAPFNLSTNDDDKREIEVSQGNFMMTSAKLSTETGEAGFSYYKNPSNKEPNAPSLLELDGPNTSMKVSGLSYIDAPKRRRRPSSTKNDPNPNFKSGYISGKNYLNRINLKYDSQLDLGTAGIEPFILTSEDNTIFKMKVLPDLELFDTAFLEMGLGVKPPVIRGKVILEMFNSQDADKLADILTAKGISFVMTNDEATARNMRVTIIKPDNDRTKENLELITRKFYYTDNVSY